MIKQIRMHGGLVRYMKEVALNSVERRSRHRLERKREGCGGFGVVVGENWYDMV